MPFSYMAVTATPSDGNAHSVQIYSDISSEWVSGNDDQKVNWTTTTGDVIIHQAQLQEQTLFSDSGDRIQCESPCDCSSFVGSRIRQMARRTTQPLAYVLFRAYWRMSHSLYTQSSSTTWQTGEDTVIRAQFINNGTLLNTQDTNFRAINDKWPCYGFAHDLGNITDASTAVFVIGQARDPVVNYITSGGSMQARGALYLSQYSSINDAVRVDPATVHRPCLIAHLAQITTFAKDYDNALSRADALDLQITQDATAISGNYSEIVSLSVRQTLGALEFTYTPGNSSDVMAFVKGTLIFLSACGAADSVRHSIRD